MLRSEERYSRTSRAKVSPTPRSSKARMQFHMHSSPDGIHWKFLGPGIQAAHIGAAGIRSGIIFWRSGQKRSADTSCTPRPLGQPTASHTTERRGKNSARTTGRSDGSSRDDLINWDNQKTVMWPDEEDLATYETGAPLERDRAGKTLRRGPRWTITARPCSSKYPRSAWRVRHARQSQLVLVQPRVGGDRGPRRHGRSAHRDAADLRAEPLRRMRLSVSRDGVNFQRFGGRRLRHS